MNKEFRISEIESEKEVRIAEEDIICYETFLRPQGLYLSLYEYNEVGCEAFAARELIRDKEEIHGGFKSFIHVNKGDPNFKFAIPKGSKYYVNSEMGLYISERIILADTEPYFYIDNSNEEYLKSKDIIATEDDIKDDFQCLVDAGKTKEEVIEIMNKMLDEQYRQGNPKNIEFMGKHFGSPLQAGGFDVGYSIYGVDYWKSIENEIIDAGGLEYKIEYD